MVRDCGHTTVLSGVWRHASDGNEASRHHCNSFTMLLLHTSGGCTTNKQIAAYGPRVADWKSMQ